MVTVDQIAEKRSAKTLKLMSALEEREARLASLDAQAGELKAEEDRAVRDALMADPTRSAFQRGAPAQVLRERREKLLRSREGLETERLALQAQVSAAASREAAERFSDITKDRLRRARDVQRLQEEAGDLLAQLGNTWSGYATAQEQINELQATVYNERLREQVALFDPQAASAWDQADGQALGPPAVSFADFIEMLTEASQNPGEAGALGEVMPDLSGAPTLPRVTGCYTPRHARQALRVNYRDPETGELLPAA